MLKLRLETDPMFKEAGLNGFYIERANGAKSLQIVGSCGKPIYTIYGVEASARLNKEERAYLVSFIENLLKNKKDMLLRIIELNGLISDTKEVMDAYKEISPQRSYYNGMGTIKVHVYKVEYGTVYYDGKDVEIVINKSPYEKIKKLMDDVPKIKKELSEYMKIDEELSGYIEELNELNSCKL